MSLWFGRKDEPQVDGLIMVLVILVSIFSLPTISNLQVPPKAMAQAPSEGANVLLRMNWWYNYHPILYSSLITFCKL